MLGLNMRQIKKFTEQEDNYLRKYSEYMTCKEMAEQLNRPHSSVTCRVKSLGLKLFSDLPNEEWVLFHSYKKKNYYISNHGRVCVNQMKLLKLSKTKLVPGKNNTQYYQITLGNNDGSRTCYKIHSLVASYFIRRSNPGEEINHIDGNGLNNSLSNLEWSTKSKNLIHARDNCLTNIKLTSAIVKNLRSRFDRFHSKEAVVYLKQAYDIEYLESSMYNVLAGNLWKQ